MKERSTIIKPGEGLLVAGLLALLVSAYLLPQHMAGFFAFLTGLLALALLFSGVVRAQEGAHGFGRQASGFFLLFLGIGGLFAGTIVAADAGAREARLAQARQQNSQNTLRDATPVRPEIRSDLESRVQSLDTPHAQAPNVHWVVKSSSRLTPVFMGLGLLWWTRWSFWRCLTWAGVVLLIVPAIKLMIHTLGPWMALGG